MGLILLLLFITPAGAQFLSPTPQLQATFPLNTTAITIGKTQITGQITGIDSTQLLQEYTQDLPIDQILQTQYNLTLENLRLYPLIAHTSLPSITKITLIELAGIDFDSLEDLITLYTENIKTYTNVHITTENGLFIYGTQQPQLPLNLNLSNAITGTITFPLQEGITNTFLATITTETLPLYFDQTPSILIQPTEQGQITITSEDNTILYKDNKPNTIIIIEDPETTLQQQPPLYLFPIESIPSAPQLTLNIQPAQQTFTNIPDLIDDIQNSLTTIGNTSTFELPLEGFTNLIDTAAQIINGAIILINTTNTIQIDQTTQNIQQIGFFRGESYQLTLLPATQETTLTGSFRLIFLGDHLYTTQAADSDNGVAFPWIILLIWILAIALYVYTKFYFKTQPPEPQEKHYPLPLPLLFHLLLIIITFILIDREISFQFGISALDALTGQGINEIFAVTLLLQLIMWVIGYLLLVIPLRIILKILLPYLILDEKTNKGLYRGLSLLTIWIFTALYIKLIINIFLQIIGQQIPLLPI
jgi:hypothetical protein